MAQTHYETLHINKSASSEEIKSSYRKLSIQFHPDKNQGSTEAVEKFMEISKAYEILSDPEKRKKYDIELSSPKPSHTTSFSFSQQKGSGAQFDLASALQVFMQNIRGDQSIQDKLSGREIKHDPTEGTNIQIHVALSLSEILNGCQKTIKIKQQKKCDSCQGTGSQNQKLTLKTCEQCAGNGKVRIADTSETITCNMCIGTGAIPNNACISCNGTGLINGETKISVKFPAGIAEGNYITLQNMGNAGIRNGKKGDLILFIDEIPQTVFIRKGYDLETTTTIPLSTAVLGGTASITDLTDTMQSFRIPPGTQSSTVFCIQGKGLPFYKQKGIGNLYVSVQIEIPKNLTDQQEKSFQEFVSLYEETKTNKLYRKIGLYYVIDAKPKDGLKTFKDFFDTAGVLTDAQVPIVLNCLDVNLVDSVGLGYMMEIHKNMMVYNEKLRLVNVSDALMEIFKDCCLDTLFTIISDEHELNPTEKNSDKGSNGPGENGTNGHHLVRIGKNCSVTALEDHGALEYLSVAGNSVGLDLSGVTVVGSDVLGSWIKYYKVAKSNGADFFLLSPNDAIISTLQTTNLDKLLKIVKSENDLM